MNFSSDTPLWMIVNAALACMIAGSIITLAVLSIVFPSKMSKKEARELHWRK